MYEKNFVFSCYGLFLLITLSRSLQNYINEKDYNLTARYKIDTDSTTIYNNKIKPLQYDLYKKFNNNTRDKMQNEFRTKNEDVDTILNKLNRRSVQNPEDDARIPINSHANSTNVNYKENFTSQKVYENFVERNDSTSYNNLKNSNENGTESDVVPYEMCHNITCIQLCCPLGNRMSMDGNCISGDIKYDFPNVEIQYTNYSMQSENKENNELIQLTVYDSCKGALRFVVDEGHQYDYTIFTNGSIYLSYFHTLFTSTSYCLGVFFERGNKYEVTFCSEIVEQVVKNAMKYTPAIRSVIDALKLYASLHMLCVLFLVPVFLVYTILPELRNVHGFMLCNYTAATSIAIIVHFAKALHYKAEMSHPVCITIAFLEYFFIMSSFFWLSAMSFNIWRTFRGFSLLQKNVRLSEKRKMVYYTIFAYGGPLILGIVCVIIMDFISDYIPKNLRPEFNTGNCWFFGTIPFLLYFYWIKSFCVISSVCLSISAALKIKRYEKIADFRQTDSENMLYNDNKKWFNLYKSLFILLFVMMGITWSMITISWIFGAIMQYYIPYIIAFFDIVQSLFIFIIFVWKKDIKLMLLKQFGRKMTKTSNT